MVASGRESSRCSPHDANARAIAQFATNDCTGYKLMQSGLLPGGLRLYWRPCGDVAQLGERRVRNAEVEGSIPFVSTRYRRRRLSVGVVVCSCLLYTSPSP